MAPPLTILTDAITSRLSILTTGEMNASGTKVLSEDEIKHAINKGASFIRKCSDPDPDSDGIKRIIDHKDSVQLDLACVRKGISPPLLTSHQYIIDHEKNKLDNEDMSDVSRMLVKFSILEGELNLLVQNQ